MLCSNRFSVFRSVLISLLPPGVEEEGLCVSFGGSGWIIDVG